MIIKNLALTNNLSLKKSRKGSALKLKIKTKFRNVLLKNINHFISPYIS